MNSGETVKRRTAAEMESPDGVRVVVEGRPGACPRHDGGKEDKNSTGGNKIKMPGG